MFWADFGQDETLNLVALDGTVDADGIYELYLKILPDFIHSANILTHSNASVYIAKVIKDLLEEMSIEAMV